MSIISVCHMPRDVHNVITFCYIMTRNGIRIVITQERRHYNTTKMGFPGGIVDFARYHFFFAVMRK